MKAQFSSYTSGFGLILGLGILAHFTAPFIPGMNGVLLGLILGLLLGNLVKLPVQFQPGINLSSSTILEIAIVLLAFGINIGKIGEMGGSTFVIIALMVLLMLFLTLILSKEGNCPGSTGWLVGFGTTICGSSAIAAVAPSISKDKSEIGIALAVVNLMGGIGMVALPFILPLFHFDNLDAGILVGGSLHSVGNVAGAGYAMSEEIGNTALTVKMVRVALLAPAVILFSYLINRKETKNWKDHFKLPLYLWAFIVVTVLVSTVDLPAALLKQIDFVGKITLTMAMTAIGMKISFTTLFHSGRKAIGFGLVIFGVQLLVLLGLLMILG
jgi:uncharacterized integral membrane protein (TIGR00698 family)